MTDWEIFSWGQEGRRNGLGRREYPIVFSPLSKASWRAGWDEENLAMLKALAISVASKIGHQIEESWSEAEPDLEADRVTRESFCKICRKTISINVGSDVRPENAVEGPAARLTCERDRPPVLTEFLRSGKVRV